MLEVRPGCKNRAYACPKMVESFLSLLLISTPNSPSLFLQSHRRTWLKNPMPITSLGPKQRAGSTQSPGRASAQPPVRPPRGEREEREGVRERGRHTHPPNSLSSHSHTLPLSSMHAQRGKREEESSLSVFWTTAEHSQFFDPHKSSLWLNNV